MHGEFKDTYRRWSTRLVKHLADGHFCSISCGAGREAGPVKHSGINPSARFPKLVLEGTTQVAIFS